MLALTWSLFWIFTSLNVAVVLILIAAGSFDRITAPKWCSILPTVGIFTGPIMLLCCFLLLVQPETLRSVLTFFTEVVDRHMPEEGDHGRAS